MNADATPRRHRQRRGGGVCDGAGQGRGAGRGGAGGRGSLSSRTATRALIAAGTYVAQDLRDPDGVTRPLLRRTALRMVASPMKSIRGIGTAYLRGDPPTSGELEAGYERARLRLPQGGSAETPEDAVWEADDTSSPV